MVTERAFPIEKSASVCLYVEKRTVEVLFFLSLLALMCCSDLGFSFFEYLPAEFFIFRICLPVV